MLGAVLLMTGTAALGQSVSEQYLLAAANQDRAVAGLQPLHADLLLAQAALQHAREMARQGTISHQFQGEADLAERVGAAGARFSLITENVAEASNSALIHDLWMHSAGHRANLLDAKVDAVGIAVVAVHGQLYAVEDFARTVQHLGLQEQEAQVAGLLEGAGMRVVADAGDARQTCQVSTGFVGRQPWFVMRYTTSDLGHLPAQLTEKVATGKYHQAAVGACVPGARTPFSNYSVAVLLYP